MDSSLGAMVEAYLAGPSMLRQSVAGMFPEHLTARPIEGKWSTLEVVCHIADFEPILADRMKRIIAEDRPRLVGVDPDLLMKNLRPHSRDMAEELALVELTRKQMARILGKLKPEALARDGIHNERGSMSLEKVLKMAIKHIPHHVEFIHEKREALGVSI